MPTMKLTDAAVQRLKTPQSGRVEYFDISRGSVPGFGVRVSHTGRKTWIIFYRLHGRQVRQSLGRYPAMELGEAREAARKALKAAERGEDARVAQREEREKKADTVETVANLFIERYAKKRNRRWRETERIFDTHVKPKWKGRPIGSIRKTDVVDLLDDIVDRAPVMGNRVLAAVRKFFNWCVERGLVETSPVSGISPPSPERKRDRVLDDEELKDLWAAWDELGAPFGPLSKVLLLTAQRRDEVGQMRWRDLDFDAKVWTIPREMSKNNEPHMVPLSEPVAEILASVPKIADENGKLNFVFTTNGERPVSGFSKAKARTDTLVIEGRTKALKAAGEAFEEVEGLEPWRLHDLRRTAASGMARLNVPPHVVEKVLNHISGTFGGVAGIYNRFQYEEEKRNALDAWGRYVIAMVGGDDRSNVVELHA